MNAFKFAAGLVLGVGGLGATAHAGTINVEVSFEVEDILSGADADGLVGSTVVFEAVFDDTSQFTTTCCSQPSVSALSHSFTVTGSGSADGTYTDPVGVAVFPNNTGFDGFFSVIGDFMRPDGLFSAVSIAGAMADVSDGDVITAALLVAAYGTQQPGATSATDGTEYLISNFMTTVTTSSMNPIPVPAAALLFGPAFALVAARRRARA